MIAPLAEPAIIKYMRQMIVRLDDDLHARLKERAADEHTSLNAVAVEALEAFLARPETPRQRLARKAKRLGIPVVERPPGTPPFDLERHNALRAELPPGLGEIVDMSLAEDREWYDR